MKIRLLIVTAIICLTSINSNFASEISGSSGVDFVSKYIWRGFNLSDGNNTQPFAELSYEGLTLGYWGSFNWDEADTNLEQDLYISYDFSIMDEALGISLGYTHYKFPSLGSDKSDEIWVGISFDKIPLNPSLTAYIDFGDEDKGGADGQYYSFGISKDIELSRIASLSFGANIGYNNELFTEESGFADFVPSLSLSFQLSETLSIGISANYSTVIDSDLEESMGADDEFYAVFSIGVG